MDGKFKKLIIIFIVIAVIGFAIYWAGLASPKKEVIFKKEMVQDVTTKEVHPYYSVYYKWDGKQQQKAWWVVFKKHGEWKVLELAYIKSSKGEEDYLKHARKFDHNWINDYDFSAQPTRYQLILQILDFQPKFTEEKKVFYKILDEIKTLKKD
jgi:hypothetical protein